MRFKYGIHTIFLFLDSLAPFSEVSDELLALLKDRYPDGLTTSLSSPDRMPISDSAALVYGVFRVPNDSSKGWKRLKIGDNGHYTPTKCGLKNNSIVAFTLVEDPDSDVEFEVEWPQEDEEVYDPEA